MATINSYHSLHAKNYNLIYGDKPYADEARFVHEVFLELSGRRPQSLLDVACGTGRHAMLFEQLGCQATGVDLSPALLELGTERAKGAGSKVVLAQHDMRRLPKFPKPFDVATCLFDSLGYALTDEDILATLDGIRNNLVPGGMFAVEVIHTPAMLRHHEKHRVRRWPLGTDRVSGELLRISDTIVDPATSHFSVHYTLLELRKDGTYARAEETQRNRFFKLEELSALLNRAGFDVVRAHAGYSLAAQIDDETWHILVFVKKRTE